MLRPDCAAHSAYSNAVARSDLVARLRLASCLAGVMTSALTSPPLLPRAADGARKVVSSKLRQIHLERPESEGRSRWRSKGRRAPAASLSHRTSAGPEFTAQLDIGARPEFDPTHPWGCHRRQVLDRTVFEHVLATLVHGSGYERIATTGCSDRTIRRRLTEWSVKGIGVEVLRAALTAYERMLGLDLDDLSVDGSITTSRAVARFRVAPRLIAASRASNGRWPATA